MAMINLPRFSHGFLRAQRCGQAQQDPPAAERSAKLDSALLCLLAAVVLIFPLMVRGQELTATLSGTVTDTTGAVIPHASISIAQNGVNAGTRVVESDGSGNYVVTNLTAGTYSVTVTATGFETFKGKDIVLNVADKHSFNAQLKAGSTTTTVVVEDNPVSVDTETSNQAGTISGVQVRELEINSRNFEQLITLQPGVVNQLGDEASASSTALSVNGARTTANNWTVDGADINDSGSNGTAVNEPSMEAIQEITLQRGNYDAGYGRSGGGQVLVATRSGTSAFHGEGYEYVRNTMFDANDWLNKHTQETVTPSNPIAHNDAGVYHSNVYGFTFGGPIYIPKAYNTDKKKTFFFWSEDWHKINQAGSSQTLNTPTSSQMAGNFSTPAPGMDANGNQLPPIAPPTLPAGCTYTSYTVNADNSSVGQIDMSNPSCVSKNASIYLTNVFAKNTNDAGSETVNVPTVNDYRDDIVRVDHYFNDKVHFFARGMNDIMPVSNPLGLWEGNTFPNVAAAAVDSPGKNVVGNLSWTISPTIVNELEFVYAQGTYNSSFSGSNFSNDATLLGQLQPDTTQFPDPYNRLPAVSITNIQGIGPGSTPWKERNLDRTYFDNLAMTYGKHTIRLGFQIQQMLKTENAVAGGATFSFSQANNPFTNFILGNVSTYSQQDRDTTPDLQYYNSEAYINDDWKLTHKLTLNLGVRWSSFPSPIDKNNLLANFDPTRYSADLAPTIDPATGNFNPDQSIGGVNLLPATYANGMIFPQGNACTQAQSYSPQVQCSPYGKTIDPSSNANFAPRVGFAFNPDGHGITSIRGGFGIFYDRILNGIFEQSAFYDPPVVQSVTVNNTSFDKPLAVAGAVSYGPNKLYTTGIPTFKTPNYADFNLTVERQLLPTTVLSVAYVGGQGRHLLGELDMNQPTVGARLANPTADVNYIRPYKGYSFFDTKASVFTSNYNSLQIAVNHHSSDGLTVGAAYTWAKTMTTTSVDRAGSLNGNSQFGPTDSYNLKMDYGPAGFNLPQSLIFNYVYEAPFYKSQSNVEGKFLGGWELSGVTTMLTGQSVTVTQAEDPFDSANADCGPACGPRGLGIQIVDADIAARPMQVSKVHMVRSASANEWFDPSAFKMALGQFGNTRNGSILGPGMQKWDVALAKNTNIGEHVRFQLRAEAFNVFNHPNFSSIQTNFDAGRTSTTTTAWGPNFGQITGDHEPRLLQLGGKIMF
jgi:hypothetical protein